jgi:hypothetical protein
MTQTMQPDFGRKFIKKLSISTFKILKNISKSPITLKRVLSKLVEADKIHRVGKARATKYQYVNNDASEKIYRK